MLPICESCSTAAPLPRSLHLSLRPELIGGRGGGGTLSNHWAHGAASLEVVGRRSAHACGMGASHHTSTARYGESMALSELYNSPSQALCLQLGGRRPEFDFRVAALRSWKRPAWWRWRGWPKPTLIARLSDGRRAVAIRGRRALSPAPLAVALTLGALILPCVWDVALRRVELCGWSRVDVEVELLLPCPAAVKCSIW